MAPKTVRRTASLYLRISVAAEESDSIVRQERDLRRLAKEEGLEVVEVRVDEGVSGSALERPAFRAWLDDARTGRADTLLAWRFDRVSREGLVAVASILDVLKVNKARLLTYGDRADSDSPTFRLTAAVLSEVAYAEREAIKARVTSRQASDRAKGAWTKARPFGYDVVDRRLVQRHDEAAIVRDMVDRFLAGASLRSLAAHLDAEGVPTPRALKGHAIREGATWGMSSVRAILANPALAGHYPTKGPDGRMVPARDDSGDVVSVTDEPILSPGTHAAVLQLLDSRSTLGPTGPRRRGAAPKHPLSGLLKCECGGAAVYMGRATSGRPAAFRCQRHAHSKTSCPGVYVGAEAVEAAVARRVLSYLPALDPEDEQAERIAARWLSRVRPEDSAERTAAVSAVADAEAQVADLEAARYERGEFPGADGAARWQRLYDRALARLEAARVALAAFPDDALDVGALLDRDALREALEAGEDADRRGLYTLVIDRVVILRDKDVDLDDRLRVTWAGEEAPTP